MPDGGLLACEGTLGSFSVAWSGRTGTVEDRISGRDALEGGLSLIDAVLTRAEVTLGELDALACTIGPGAFTSLCIALSLCKSLAFASGVPLVGVSTYDLLDASWATTPGAERPRAIFLQPRAGVLSASLREGETVLHECSGPAAEVVRAVGGRLPAGVGQIATMLWPAEAAEALTAAGWTGPPAAPRTESPAVLLLEIAAARLPATPRGNAAVHAIDAEYGEAPATTGGAAA